MYAMGVMHTAFSIHASFDLWEHTSEPLVGELLLRLLIARFSTQSPPRSERIEHTELEYSRWIAGLESPNLNVSFTETVLARHGVDP